jgi:hypothetical protein
MTRIRGPMAEEYRSLLQSIVRDVESLDSDTLVRIAPVIARAQQETERALRAWLARQDGEERFTTQKYRNALLQLREAGDAIGRIRPELEKTIRQGTSRAGILATKHIERSLLHFGDIFEGTVQPVALDSAVIMSRADNLLVSHYRASLRRYDSWARERLALELATGKIRGESIEQLGNRLERSIPEVFTGMRRRAHLVARTEVMNGYNEIHKQGLHEAQESLDVELLMRWDSAMDHRRCPRCAALDGAVVALDGEFKAEWKELRAGKPVTFTSTHSRPPAHPNCRCVLVPWAKEWGDLPGMTKNPKPPETARVERSPWTQESRS